MTEYEHRRESPERLPEILKSIPLDHLKSIAQSQRMVGSLTDGFYRSALSRHPLSGESLSPGPLSRNEKRRINRALFPLSISLQLFCKLKIDCSPWPHCMYLETRSKTPVPALEASIAGSAGQFLAWENILWSPMSNF